MRFIQNGKLVNKEQSEKSKNCYHKINVEKIGDTTYRYCENCGMLAHEDGVFAYYCGSDWCRCGQ